MAKTFTTSAFARLVPYRLRRAHQFWAWRMRYFWLPCPMCGKPFGGHEWRTLPGGAHAGKLVDGHRMGICPPCTKAIAATRSGR